MEGRVEEKIWGGISNTKGLLKKTQGNLLLSKFPKIYTHLYTYMHIHIHTYKETYWIYSTTGDNTPTRHFMLVNESPTTRSGYLFFF